jgi:hypothetical protein
MEGQNDVQSSSVRTIAGMAAAGRGRIGEL